MLRGVKKNFIFYGLLFYSPFGPRAGAGGPGGPGLGDWGAKGLEVSREGQLDFFFQT